MPPEVKSMSDRVAVECSHCKTQYALPSQFLGKKATCKKCGQKFVAQFGVVAPHDVAPAGILQPRPTAVAATASGVLSTGAASAKSGTIPSRLTAAPKV